MNFERWYIMAKRLIDWTILENSAVLTISEYIDTDTESKKLFDFDLVKLYPDFLNLNKVQQFLIVYGIKQKLADSGSSEKTAEGKCEAAQKKFALFAKGELAGERSNSTGAKAAKAFVANMKETAKTVSLEGLMVKKLTNAENFSEDDQKKLDEFISLQAKHLESEAKKKKVQDIK